MNKQQAAQWLKNKDIDPQCMIPNTQGPQKFFNLSQLISESTQCSPIPKLSRSKRGRRKKLVYL